MQKVISFGNLSKHVTIKLLSVKEYPFKYFIIYPSPNIVVAFVTEAVSKFGIFKYCNFGQLLNM